MGVQPVDVETSDLRAAVEGGGLRLGLSMVSGLGELGGQNVVEARRFGPFRSLADFCRRTKLGRRAVEGLELDRDNLEIFYQMARFLEESSEDRQRAEARRLYADILAAHYTFRDVKDRYENMD